MKIIYTTPRDVTKSYYEGLRQRTSLRAIVQAKRQPNRQHPIAEDPEANVGYDSLSSAVFDSMCEIVSSVNAPLLLSGNKT